MDVTAETCPHYLLLDAEADLPRVKAFAKINPSILRQPEREALWAHLLAGRIDFIASDHAPWPLERKLHGDIFENPSGAPGLETSLPLMHDALVERRGKDPAFLARLLAAHPARRFGLAPRKGSIALGADADFAILDPRLPPHRGRPSGATPPPSRFALTMAGRPRAAWCGPSCAARRSSMARPSWRRPEPGNSCRGLGRLHSETD